MRYNICYGNNCLQLDDFFSYLKKSGSLSIVTYLFQHRAHRRSDMLYLFNVYYKDTWCQSCSAIINFVEPTYREIYILNFYIAITLGVFFKVGFTAIRKLCHNLLTICSEFLARERILYCHSIV